MDGYKVILKIKTNLIRLEPNVSLLFRGWSTNTAQLIQMNCSKRSWIVLAVF